MGVTLKDVAVEAGVSLATASRAFHSADLLAPGTRQRVIRAAVELGYSMASRSRDQTLVVIVPDISNPVYATLVQLLQQNLWTNRHRMILVDSAEDPTRELVTLRTLGSDVVGVMVISPRSRAADIREAAAGCPVVILNSESAGLPSVILNVESGMRQAVEHLYAFGHRHIAYVPGPPASWANSVRSDTLAKYSEQHGIKLSLVGNQAATIQGGSAAAAAVVVTQATAAVAYNDMVAIGLQRGLRGLGVQCPRDVSIVGIDDVNICAAMNPELTTIRMDHTRCVALGLEFLLSMVEGIPVSSNSVLQLESQLIVRESTAALQRLNSRDERS